MYPATLTARNSSVPIVYTRVRLRRRFSGLGATYVPGADEGAAPATCGFAFDSATGMIGAALGAAAEGGGNEDDWGLVTSTVWSFRRA